MDGKEIYLLRHGDTGYKNQYIGSSDVSLSVQGNNEALQSCTYLSSVDFDTVLCSPMKRCVETVGHLSSHCPVVYQDYLKEINFGRWEKKTFEDILQSDKAEVDKWASNPDTFTFPGGESLEEFQHRISSITTHLYDLDAKKILVVCHGGVIRHLICKLLRIPKEQYLLFEIQYGSFSTIRLHQEGGVLTGLNLRG